MKVTFAAAASGKSYFERFIEDLAKPDRAVILAVFQDISEYGLNAKGCDFRQLEGKLWEIKTGLRRVVTDFFMCCWGRITYTSSTRTGSRGKRRRREN